MFKLCKYKHVIHAYKPIYFKLKYDKIVFGKMYTMLRSQKGQMLPEKNSNVCYILAEQYLTYAEFTRLQMSKLAMRIENVSTDTYYFMYSFDAAFTHKVFSIPECVYGINRIENVLRVNAA